MSTWPGKWARSQHTKRNANRAACPIIDIEIKAMRQNASN